MLIEYSISTYGHPRAWHKWQARKYKQLSADKQMFV